MVHTGPLFTVAHKTRYESLQRSLSQAKSKNIKNKITQFKELQSYGAFGLP